MADFPVPPVLPVPKPWISGIHAYIAGKSAGADGRPLVKLSANENPWGCSPAVLTAREHIAHPALYPDPDSHALRRALGKLHGIDPACIVCGTGSGELLTVAASAFAGPGDEVLYMRYGFSLYDIAARRCGATPVVVPDRDYGTDVDAVIAHVTPQTRVIFIANPNNPTGSFLPGPNWRGCMRRCPAMCCWCWTRPMPNMSRRKTMTAAWNWQRAMPMCW